MLRRMFSGSRESTVTSTKSEAWDPVLIFALAGAIGDFVILGLILIAFIVWWKLDFDGWWDWFREWWTFLFIPLIVWWISLPAVFVIGRLLLELYNRHWPPVYQAADPELGLLGPFQSKKKRSTMKTAYLAKFGYTAKEAKDE